MTFLHVTPSNPGLVKPFEVSEFEWINV